MNRLPLSLVAAAALGTVASAQQALEIYPGVTSFASRGNTGTGAGELIQGFHSSVNHGLGDNGTNCVIAGNRYLVQDQVGATADTYSIVLRSGTDAAGPTPGAAGEIARGGPFAMPPSTAPGPVAWIITLTWATPIAVPCTGFFSVGLDLPVATSSADLILAQAANNVANAQHASSVDMAWQLIGGTVSHPSQKRSWRLGLILAQNALQAGNSDATAPGTHFGNGGYFPNTALTGTGATSQGIGFRCAHNLGAAGVAAILMSIDFGAAPFTVPGFGNTVYLDLGTVAPFALTGPSNGSTLGLVTNGLDALPSAGGLRLCFQGVVIDFAANTFDMTNAVIVTLN